MSRDTGGSAFPVSAGENKDGHHAPVKGMSLRDYFAAKAMQAWLVNVTSPKKELCASVAYGIADAMLLEREK